MKTLLATLLTLLLVQSAYGKDIASYRFALHTGDRDNSRITVYETTVSDKQELEIKMTTTGGHFPFYLPVGETEVVKAVKSLNDSVYGILKASAVNLSKAKITTKTAQIICMMMPGPAASNNHLSVATDYDYHTDDFTGAMKLVLGPQGCWVRKPVFPANQYDRATAKELKALIKILVLDFVGQ